MNWICIVAAANAHAAVGVMAETGLLWEVIPELAAGIGMEQPKSHHLDVWRHNLETLRQMERIHCCASRIIFPTSEETMTAYLAGARQRRASEVGRPAARPRQACHLCPANR